MSAEIFVKALRRQQPPRKGFPAGARTHLLSVAAAAVALTVILSVRRPGNVRWGEFVAVIVLAAFVQAFAEHTTANQLFHAGLAFTIAAALLLPPQLVVAVCVAQHLPDWVRHRYPWYIQTFNIANYAVSGLLAWWAWHALGGGGGNALDGDSLAAAIAAGLAFVLVNHVLLARMLMLARGRTLRQSGLFGADSILADLVLAGIGILFALSVRNAPWLAPLAVLPIALIHRAFVVPTLREQAFKDHKTGVLNSRGLEQAAENELARAQRFDRPLSVLMCDVDGLRAINNTLGHLAGDEALAAIAETLCAELREYDLCGRFGGDEFVVVLPEADLAEAVGIAERVQRALDGRSITTSRGNVPLRISIGAAMREHERRLTDLIERADAAMYEAKRGSGAVVSAVASD